MSEAQIEEAMASIRLHLEAKTLLSQDDVRQIAGDAAAAAIERLFESGQIAKTLAAGYTFYSSPPENRKN